MKKLLSILSASGIIYFASSNVISCTEQLKDLANLKINPLQIESTTGSDGENIWRYVREVIAGYSDKGITANDIKNDNTDFWLALWQGNVEIKDSQTSVYKSVEKIQIKYNITSDKWFQKTNGWVVDKLYLGIELVDNTKIKQ